MGVGTPFKNPDALAVPQNNWIKSLGLGPSHQYFFFFKVSHVIPMSSPHGEPLLLSWACKAFPENGYIVNSSGSLGHTVSVATILLCLCSRKAATDNMQQKDVAVFQWNVIYKNRRWLDWAWALVCNFWFRGLVGLQFPTALSLYVVP